MAAAGLKLRFAEKNTHLGFFRHEVQDLRRLALIARWVFEEKFDSVFQLRQPAKGVQQLRPAQEAPTLSTASGTHHEEAGRNRDSFPSAATE